MTISELIEWLKQQAPTHTVMFGGFKTVSIIDKQSITLYRSLEEPTTFGQMLDALLPYSNEYWSNREARIAGGGYEEAITPTHLSYWLLSAAAEHVVQELTDEANSLRLKFGTRFYFGQLANVLKYPEGF
jgi:hypothetical protein